MSKGKTTHVLVRSNDADCEVRSTGRLIALEGTPGAGKTTVWNRLKQESSLGFSAHFAPVLIEPPEWSSAQKYQRSDLIAKVDRWYLDEDVRRATPVRQHLASGIHVIQDRSFLSTLCFAFARSAWLKDLKYFDALQEIFADYRERVLVPDLVLSLIIPWELSHQRTAKNDSARAAGPWASARFIEAWHEFIQNQARSYLPAHTAFIELDASKLTAVETYEQIKSLLGRLVA